jgi:carbon-monoxide dehydrogenase small subunit
LIPFQAANRRCAAHSISVTGRGQDRITRSNVQGSLNLQLEEIDPATIRANVTLSFDLQGMLAQFSRSSILREFTARLVNEFAERASAILSGQAPATEKQNAVGFASLARWSFLALWNSLRGRRS